MLTFVPTKRTVELFEDMGKSPHYCRPMRCWLSKDMCTERHEMAKTYSNKAIESGLDLYCLKCEVFDDYEVPKKKCSMCGEIKPATLDYFTRRINALYGINGICKVCTRKMGREYSRKKLKNKGGTIDTTTKAK